MHGPIPQLLLGMALLGGGGCSRPAADKPEVRLDTSQSPSTGAARATTHRAAFTPAEEHAVAAIRDLGGRVFVDYRADGQPVVAVNLSRSQATDADLKPLEDLRCLAFLYLEESFITDAGLVTIGKLTQLQGLDLGHTRITDAGLARLGGLRQTKFLTLTAATISDEGLKCVTEMGHLQELRLGFTRISDAGLVSLRGLKKLEVLDLAATAITDAGLEHLQGLTELRRLTLDETKVTPAGVGRLAKGLPALRSSR